MINMLQLNGFLFATGLELLAFGQQSRARLWLVAAIASSTCAFPSFSAATETRHLGQTGRQHNEGHSLHLDGRCIVYEVQDRLRITGKPHLFGQETLRRIER